MARGLTHLLESIRKFDTRSLPDRFWGAILQVFKAGLIVFVLAGGGSANHD
jgi:hypothetical protein